MRDQIAACASPYQVTTTSAEDLETALQQAMSDLATYAPCVATVMIFSSASFTLAYDYPLQSGWHLVIDATQVSSQLTPQDGPNAPGSVAQSEERVAWLVLLCISSAPLCGWLLPDG
jgi:hypothetical protein